MRRLTVQLFLPILLVVVAFFLVTVLYWSRAFERLYIDSLTERLQREARLVADAVAWGPRGEELDRICRLRANEIGGRVTVVADDGTVLGESEEPSSAMENHGQRPEIVEARTDGLGKKTRFSHTVGYDMLYVAIADRRASELRFVRVALPLRALGEVKRVVRTILAYGFLLAVALGGGAAFFLSRRIASRVRRIPRFFHDGTGPRVGMGIAS